MAETLYIPNNLTPEIAVPDTKTLLLEALETIVETYPPRETYPDEATTRGLWSGPTGIAYLFLHVAEAHPELKIASQFASHWATAYITSTRAQEVMVLDGKKCGISCEALCYPAVRAAVTKDVAYVHDFVRCALAIPTGSYPSEWLHGKAGTLYLIRLIQHWFPDSAELLEELKGLILQRIAAEGPDWKFHGHRYLGAAHGVIGIVAQVMLTSPKPTPQLSEKLSHLLDIQDNTGNWEAAENSGSTKPYVQFCHGAPGFLLTFQSVREHFPLLQERIDAAMSKSYELNWSEGILKKKPNLCHGLFGNSLAMLPRQKRDALLTLGTPESVNAMRRKDSNLFEKADYGYECSLMTGYWPGAAWVWLIAERPHTPMIGYNDV